MQDQFDRVINYARLSVTDLCNFRCRYCMPEDGVKKMQHENILSLEQLYKISASLVGLGIDKIRITGGEPLVRKNLLWLVQKLGELPLKSLGLTTNGFYLYENAQSLKDAGVSKLNVSLDTLDGENFSSLTRGGDLAAVLKGLDKACDVGFEIKLNAVYLKGINDNDLPNFLSFCKKRNIRFRFIELMPFCGQLDFYNQYGSPISNLISDFDLKDGFYLEGTEREYDLNGQKFGIISPVSHKFCGDCNRIRITSTGGLLPCLHSKKVVDLSPFIDDNDALAAAIRGGVNQKPKEHHLSDGIYQPKDMFKIGG